MEVLTTKKMTPENREYLKKAIPEMLAKNGFLSSSDRFILGHDGSEFKVKKNVYGPINPDDYAPPIEQLPTSIVKNM